MTKEIIIIVMADFFLGLYKYLLFLAVCAGL